MAFNRWLGMAAVGAAAAALAARRRFRRELGAMIRELEAGGTVASTSAGEIEYGRCGKGEPVLIIHGAGGGYDQGLAVARDLFGEGYEVIAPSRFGYLRTPVPADFSPAAQADAHAALLDSLGVGRCIVAGVSAGAPSAIEMALRHPERVAALLLFVPRAWEPGQVMGVADTAANAAIVRLMEGAADFAYWLAIRFARGPIVRFLGVAPELEAAAPAQERERVTAIMRSILPLSRRAAGIRADSATSLYEWPLDRIRVPTLIVSAADDLFRTVPGAEYTARHIKGARLEVLESGGHLMVGRGEEVRRAVADFLRDLESLPKAA